MEKIAKIFIERKMLVKVLVAAIFLYGTFTAFKIKQDAFPEMTFGQIVITTLYPGASARDVEMNVTVPIERELQEVSGVKDIISVSNEAISKIIVNADENARVEDIQQLYNDIDSAISKIDDLPSELDGPPTLQKITTHDFPFIEIAFSGDYKLLIKHLPEVRNRLRKIENISSAEMIGLPDPEINVLVDPEKARREYIGLKMIARSIQERNLEGSGGTLESFVGEKKVVSVNKYSDYREIKNTNLRTSPDSTRFGVKLREVADVKILPEDNKLIVRNNGQRGATIILKKNKNGDVVKTSELVYRFLETMELPDGIKWKLLLDNSRLAKNRLNLALDNAFIGLVIVILLLFIIFDIKSAFWTAFGIPFSVLFAIIFLYGSRMTLNLISVGGIIVVIGMLVDDAIVVTEQYQQNRASGMSGPDAAFDAVKQMWRPVLAGLSTTALAFMPLVSLGGFPGKFIWQIPFVLTIALIGSMIDVFFFLPAHLSDEKESSGSKKRGGVRFTVLEKFYARIVKKSLRMRYIVLASSIVVLIISFIAMKNFVRKDSFPQEGVETFTIQLSFPSGQSLAGTEKIISNIEKTVTDVIHKDELLGISSKAGTNSTDILTERGTQENLGIIFVYLTPFNDRERNVFDIMKSVKDKFSTIKLPEKTDYIFDIVRIGPPMGWPLEIRVVSNNDSRRSEITEKLKQFLSGINGITEIDDDYLKGKDEINIRMNYDLLSRVGLSAKDIIDALRISFDGLVVSSIRDIEREMDIRIRLNKKARADIEYIKKLPVMNSSGNLINLEPMLFIEDRKAEGEIRHYNGLRTTTVFGNIDRNITSGEKVYEAVKSKFPKGNDYSLELSGEPVEQKKIFSSLGGAFAVSLLSIFLVMSLIFDSFSRPFIIMLSLPFCVPGAIITLLIHNYPLSMMAGAAIIGLMGVVVNASIVLISQFQAEEKDGWISSDTMASIASTRLRPIILSTLTTVAGLLPTAYGIGGYDPFISQLCAVLAWGLVFGTLVSLIIVPVIYKIGTHDIAKLIQKISISMNDKKA